MRRYRFSLEDHHVIASGDEHGCEDGAKARELADEIARHLVQAQPELADSHHRVVVRGGADREIYAAPPDSMH